MADERYEWLDKDAAEQLLRGEPVEPADDRARTDALRLAAALDAARNLPPAGGELPGETTALAAFREAAHTRRQSGAATGRATPKAQGAKAGLSKAGQSTAAQDRLPSVRIGGGRPPAGRRPRWSRPTRYGFVLSLAGCALGGVAVASGAGMLPGPFDGQGSPLPAASVSSAASPEALASELPSAQGPSLSPPGTAPGPRTSEPSENSAPGSGPSGHDSDDDSAESPGAGGSGPDESGNTRRPGDEADENHTPERPGDAGSREVYEKAAKACRDYRAGTLDRATKRRLVEMAKSEDNLDRFCARLDDKDNRNGGAEEGGSDSSEPDSVPGSDGRGSGGSGSGGEPGEGGSGALPSISFRTAPPSPDVSPDPSSHASAGTGAGSAPAASATAVASSR
ncbi:hypothetical protein ACTU45_33980 [Streptomyces sp. 24-1644]|uniref:hypothetical protein n=1 Tax=Streptomyces sp. 24-1644 TaxID=3457315 RepID=UPI003FA7A133